MKKLAIISAIALSGFIYSNANAQVRVSIGINLGGPVVVQRPVVVQQPVVVNYANDYYYLPEVDAYYSVGESMYYYNNGYNWIPVTYLPGAYRNYNWRNVRRIQVHAYRPYLNHTVYRTRYNGNQFDWRRYDNRNDRRDFDNRYDSRDWNRGNDYRNERDRRPDQRFDNRGNDNRNNGRFDRPSQNGNRGRGNNNDLRLAGNTGGRRG